MPRVRLDGGLIGVTNNPSSGSAGGMWAFSEHSKYTRSASWPAASAPVNSINAIALVVAGGGGGGYGASGGGGAGGLYYNSNLNLLTSNYTITIGAGGAGSTGAGSTGVNGSNSSITGSSNYTAIGGGGGGSGTSSAGIQNGLSGGSGGGGGNLSATLAGTGGSSIQNSTYGYGVGFSGGNGLAVSPYPGGGGGGSANSGGTASGTTAGGGGTGTAYNFANGTSTYYGGGGGGGGNSGTTVGQGGLGGGGAGSTTTAATAGTSSTGGGGGGGGGASNGGNGGSGVAIISYPLPQRFSGGIVTNLNSTNVVHTFTTSGSLNALGYSIDTYFPQTTLLLHGDGTVGANNTVFLDSSTNNLTLTTNGKPQQGTFSPFSQTGWCGQFNPANTTTDNIATTNFDLSLTPGTNDYTIEFWVFPTTTAGRQNWFNLQGSAGFNRILLYYTGTAISLDIGVGTSATSKISYTTSLSSIAFTWNHIAVSRTSGTTRMFLNGTQIGSDYATLDNWTAAFKLTTMKDPGGSTWGSGYMSNIRYIIGTGLYSSNFIPSTSNLTSVSGTRLLLLQDNFFKDNGANSQPLTITGTPSVQPFSPFSPSSPYSNTAIGGSISFNGSSDYLSSSSNVFGVGSGNFTVEFWLYKNNAWSTGNQFIVDNGATNGMQIWVNTSAGALRLGRYGVDVILDYAYSSLTPNQWYHMAYVRSGTSVALFINGTRVATATSSASFLTSSTTQNIGRSTDTTSYWNGYISNLRVINGIAAYDPTQTTITVPTAPLTANSTTTFLLNATNAGIIDHTAKNNITTYGSAAISSTQSKFGNTSMYFNGTTDYIQGTVAAPGTGDFTMEGWIYITAFNAGSPNIFSIVASGSSAGFQVYVTSSGFGVRSNTVNILNTAGTSALNSWIHVALVRYSGTMNLYINGSSISSTSTSYTFSDTQFNAGYTPIGQYFSGYIDDIRYTRVARYTSNFTPPTSTFLDR